MSRSVLFAKFSKDHNQQRGCRLFTLPAELRNRIFKIVLSSYVKITTMPTQSLWPKYLNRRIDTSLLSTCRRIYLETHLVPVYINEHLFWCSLLEDVSNLQSYFSRMTYSQRCAVVRVHFMADMEWLMCTFRTVCNLRVMSYTKHLRITIRDDGRQCMKKEWTENLVKLMNLETFKVELRWSEGDSKEKQLKKAVATMVKWRFHLQDGRVLSAAGKGVNRNRFAGSYNASQKQWYRLAGKTRVVILIWKTRPNKNP